MSKLGITIQQDVRTQDRKTPEFPLIASSYSRFGFIRLSGKPLRRREAPPCRRTH